MRRSGSWDPAGLRMRHDVYAARLRILVFVMGMIFRSRSFGVIGNNHSEAML